MATRESGLRGRGTDESVERPAAVAGFVIRGVRVEPACRMSRRLWLGVQHLTAELVADPIGAGVLFGYFRPSVMHDKRQATGRHSVTRSGSEANHSDAVLR